MNNWFFFVTIIFAIVSIVMILIVLVQRPQGGGLAGAFGGAGGGGTDTVFGGRVGDALTVMTVVAFVAYLGLAIGLNLMPIRITPLPASLDQPSITTTLPDGSTVPAEFTPAEGPPPGFLPEGVRPPLAPPATPDTTSDTIPPPVSPDDADADTDATGEPDADSPGE